MKFHQVFLTVDLLIFRINQIILQGNAASQTSSPVIQQSSTLESATSSPLMASQTSSSASVTNGSFFTTKSATTITAADTPPLSTFTTPAAAVGGVSSSLDTTNATAVIIVGKSNATATTATTAAAATAIMVNPAQVTPEITDTDVGREITTLASTVATAAITMENGVGNESRNESDHEGHSKLLNPPSDATSTPKFVPLHFFNQLNHLEVLNATIPPEWWINATANPPTTKSAVFNLIPTALDDGNSTDWEEMAVLSSSSKNGSLSNDSVGQALTNSTHFAASDTVEQSNFPPTSTESFSQVTLASLAANSTRAPSALFSVANGTLNDSFVNGKSTTGLSSPIHAGAESGNGSLINSSEHGDFSIFKSSDIGTTTRAAEQSTDIPLNGTDSELNSTIGSTAATAAATTQTTLSTSQSVTATTESPVAVVASGGAVDGAANATTTATTGDHHNATELKFFNQLNHLEVLNATIPPEWLLNATARPNATTKLVVFNLFAPNLDHANETANFTTDSPLDFGRNVTDSFAADVDHDNETMNLADHSGTASFTGGSDHNSTDSSHLPVTITASNTTALNVFPGTHGQSNAAVDKLAELPVTATPSPITSNSTKFGSYKPPLKYIEPATIPVIGSGSNPSNVTAANGTSVTITLHNSSQRSQPTNQSISQNQNSTANLSIGDQILPVHHSNSFNRTRSSYHHRVWNATLHQYAADNGSWSWENGTEMTDEGAVGHPGDGAEFYELDTSASQADPRASEFALRVDNILPLAASNSTTHSSAVEKTTSTTELTTDSTSQRTMAPGFSTVTLTPTVSEATTLLGTVGNATTMASNMAVILNSTMPGSRLLMPVKLTGNGAVGSGNMTTTISTSTEPSTSASTVNILVSDWTLPDFGGGIGDEGLPQRSLAVPTGTLISSGIILRNEGIRWPSIFNDK